MTSTKKTVAASILEPTYSEFRQLGKDFIALHSVASLLHLSFKNKLLANTHRPAHGISPTPKRPHLLRAMQQHNA